MYENSGNEKGNFLFLEVLLRRLVFIFLLSGFPPEFTLMKMGAGMTKKQALKNVIPRRDRGIQGIFN